MVAESTFAVVSATRACDRQSILSSTLLFTYRDLRTSNRSEQNFKLQFKDDGTHKDETVPNELAIRQRQLPIGEPSIGQTAEYILDQVCPLGLRLPVRRPQLRQLGLSLRDFVRHERLERREGFVQPL